MLEKFSVHSLLFFFFVYSLSTSFDMAFRSILARTECVAFNKIIIFMIKYAAHVMII